MNIEIRDGSFGYKKGRVLFDNISFSLEKGEILTILGPNGVGKTTLLKCITGIYNWKDGETYIDNISIKEYKQVDIWKKIGYVPQIHSLIFAYSVLDMVVMGRAPYLKRFSSPKIEDKEMALSVLGEMKIDYLANKSCGEISGGELQLVMIARALVADPSVLILDEPEAHLDLSKQMLILNTIERLAKDKGISCIINTHYPQHALSISDKTIMLGENKKHIYGDTADIIIEENLKEYFDLDVKILEHREDNLIGKMVFPYSLAKESNNKRLCKVN